MTDHDVRRIGCLDAGDRTAELTPQESLRTIHTTMERAHSALYVAGTSTILLLWGAIASLGYLSEYALRTLATEFTERNPWISGPIWGSLSVVGMVGSALRSCRVSLPCASGWGLVG